MKSYENCSECYSTGESAQEKGLNHVPNCYEVPPSQRSTLNSPFADVPLIDLARLYEGPTSRSVVIHSIRQACSGLGFFQVINHGIDESVIENGLTAAEEFFKLPAAEKLKFKSTDVHKAVRYSSSLKDGVDKIQFWRVFLKHYANPLKDWIQFWPLKPPTYRENMGLYCSEVQKLAVTLTSAITESLSLGPNYVTQSIQDGMQVITSNCYPPCPQPQLTLGLPPHSDYSCLTILHQNSPGLEIKDNNDNGCWKLVPFVNGALQVHIGDHFEVLSNGLYKSVVHRAVLSSDKTRISIASLHSLGLDEKMEPALELIDEDHPRKYKGSSFKDFLDFLSVNDIGQGKITFLDTLKI